MKRILITGIPGTGKTSLGQFLEKEKDFRHIEMEKNPVLHFLLQRNPEDFINSLKGKEDIVITWGINPVNDVKDVLFLKEHGFQLIWLEGDLYAAYCAYEKRVKKEDSANLEHHLENFHMQIKQLETTRVIEQINPIRVNPFNKNRSFRDTSEILKEIDLH